MNKKSNSISMISDSITSSISLANHSKKEEFECKFEIS
jgi:hypothetical protein